MEHTPIDFVNASSQYLANVYQKCVIAMLLQTFYSVYCSSFMHFSFRTNHYKLVNKRIFLHEQQAVSYEPLVKNHFSDWSLGTCYILQGIF